MTANSFRSPLQLMEGAVATNVLPTFLEIQRAASSYEPYDMGARLLFGRRFGYGIPCYETIAVIAAFQKLVEIGAGSGFWSYWLRRCGCDVVATDSKGHPSPWLGDIIRLDARKATQIFRNRAVLMVWPHFADSWPVAVVRGLPSGSILCYVGEGPHGCCATIDFFVELHRQAFKTLYFCPSPS